MLLIFSYAWQNVGLYLQHELKITSIHNNLSFKKKNNLQEVLFTKEQFNKINWIKINKEFILNGNRYDVFNRKFNEVRIILVCYRDKEEDEAFKKLSRKTQSENKHHKNKKKDNFKLKIETTIHQFSIRLNTNIVQKNYLIFSLFQKNKSEIHLKALFKPPIFNIL